MGGKHSTFNMPLWNGEFAASATRSDMEALISMITQHGKADVSALHQQPLRCISQKAMVEGVLAGYCDAFASR